MFSCQSSLVGLRCGGVPQRHVLCLQLFEVFMLLVSASPSWLAKYAGCNRQAVIDQLLLKSSTMAEAELRSLSPPTIRLVMSMLLGSQVLLSHCCCPLWASTKKQYIFQPAHQHHASFCLAWRLYY